jgi:hypothetical protein
MIINVNVWRLAVCPCGAPVLRKLGAEFAVDEEDTHQVTWHCHFCGKSEPEVRFVRVVSPATKLGYMPVRLFEPNVGQGLVPRLRTVGA